MYKQKNCIANEWRNSAVIPVFKKGERKDPKKYRGILFLDTYCKTSSKILNKKLLGYSEQFMPEIQNGFRMERSCTDTKF
jgi:hypothetical protein